MVDIHNICYILFDCLYNPEYTLPHLYQRILFLNNTKNNCLPFYLEKESSQNKPIVTFKMDINKNKDKNQQQEFNKLVESIERSTGLKYVPINEKKSIISGPNLDDLTYVSVIIDILSFKYPNIDILDIDTVS